MLELLAAVASFGVDQTLIQDAPPPPPAFVSEVRQGAWAFVSLNDQVAIFMAPNEADRAFSRFRFEWASVEFAGGLSSEAIVEFDCHGRRLRQASVRTYGGHNLQGPVSGGEVANSSWESADATDHGQDWLLRHCGATDLGDLSEFARSDFSAGVLQYGLRNELPTMPGTTADPTCHGNAEFARSHYCVWTTSAELEAVRSNLESRLAEQGLYPTVDDNDRMIFHRRGLSLQCGVLRVAAGTLVEVVEPDTPVMITVSVAPRCEPEVVLRQVYRIP